MSQIDEFGVSNTPGTNRIPDTVCARRAIVCELVKSFVSAIKSTQSQDELAQNFVNLSLNQTGSVEVIAVVVGLHQILPRSFLPALALLDAKAVELIIPEINNSPDYSPSIFYRVANSSDNSTSSDYVLVRQRSWTCSCEDFFSSTYDAAPYVSSLASILESDLSAEPDILFLLTGECPHVVAAYIASSLHRTNSKVIPTRSVSSMADLLLLNPLLTKQ
ncbi:uncharacterized protein V1516DRAFT_671612 [Lipomyces oligophaga]|uniref:uncharacterized protein n=1 Tax=Lipomyces oligophaga TaxID=45792 RepID=UPI0034CFF128